MAEFNLTDNQWYNFICGFHAGLKLRNRQDIPSETDRVLKPKPIGGKGGIGQLVSDNTWNGGNEYVFNVCVHDVDTVYSGFSSRVTWDTSKMHCLEVLDGEFGVAGTDFQYQIDNTNGFVKAYGIKSSDVEYAEPMILFKLKMYVNTQPLAGSPYLLNLDSTNTHDINYTTLLKYNDGSLYFISPLVNTPGHLFGELQQPVDTPIGPTSNTGVNAASSMIKIGHAVRWLDGQLVANGDDALVDVYAWGGNAQYYWGEPSGPYDRARMTVEVHNVGLLFDHEQLGPDYTDDPDDYPCYFVPGTEFIDDYKWSIVSQTRRIGWEPSLDLSRMIPVMFIEIELARPEAMQDNATIGFIKAHVPPGFTNRGVVTFTPKNPQLHLNGEWQPVFGRQGYLDLMGPWTVNGIPELPPDNAVGDTEGTSSGSQGQGKIRGTGEVWSDSDQVIGIKYDGLAPYYTYVKSGWNRVYFEIPLISVEPGWEEAKLTIETPGGGYILIPAGFEWTIEMDPDELPAPPYEQSSRIEKLQFEDVHDVLVIHHDQPISDQDKIDDIEFTDDYYLDIIRSPIVIDEEHTDTFSIDDEYAVDITYGPRKIDSSNIDELEIGDVYDVYKHEVFNGETKTKEEVSIEDFVNIELL